MVTDVMAADMHMLSVWNRVVAELELSATAALAVTGDALLSVSCTWMLVIAEQVPATIVWTGEVNASLAGSAGETVTPWVGLVRPRFDAVTVGDPLLVSR